MYNNDLATAYKVVPNYPNINIYLNEITSSGYTPNTNQLIGFKVECPTNTFGYFSVDGVEVATIQNNCNGNAIYEVTILAKKNKVLKFSYGGSSIPTIIYGKVLMYS